MEINTITINKIETLLESNLEEFAVAGAAVTDPETRKKLLADIRVKRRMASYAKQQGNHDEHRIYKNAARRVLADNHPELSKENEQLARFNMPATIRLK